MKSSISFAAVIAGFIVLATSVGAQEVSSREEVRSIDQITNDLYRVQAGQHFTVFLVTPQGIILGDPLNVETARWLKNEFAKRFPNQPVRYVLFSEHTFDRSGGGRVFDDTAELVAHNNFNVALQTVRSSTPELYERVVPVESDYGSRRAIVLGGSGVQLVHPSNAYAVDATVSYFETERVVFAARYLPLKSLPSSFAPSTPQAVLDWARAVDALHFDKLVSGQGNIDTKADLTAFRHYLEDLVSGVVSGIRARIARWRSYKRRSRSTSTNHGRITASEGRATSPRCIEHFARTA